MALWTLVVVAVLFVGIQVLGKIKAAFGGSVQAAGTANIQASADTYLREDVAASPGNFKIINISNVRNKKHWGLVRFTVVGLDSTATVVSANIKFYVSNGVNKNGSTVSAGYLCKAVGGSWSEGSTTWNSTNNPVADCSATFNLDTPGAPGAVPGETKISGDVSSVVTGNGTYDFYIMTNVLDDVTYSSKEADTTSAGGAFVIPDNYPTLTINWQMEGQITPTPTPTVPLTHGPFVGGVTDTVAKVFVRTSSATSVQLEYSTVPDLSSGVMQSEVKNTTSSADYTTILGLSGLSAGTTYYYSVVGNSTIYHFTTFPSQLSLPTSLQFAVFADLSSQDVTAPGYMTAANMNPAFVGQIGDLGHQPDPGARPLPIVIENWRKRFKQAYGDYDPMRPDGKDFASAFRNIPLFHIWDDHDYGKNNADKTTFSGSDAYIRPLVVNSFLEYNPLYELASGDPLNKGMWYSFRYGKLAEVYVLDVRSQRSPNSTSFSDPTKAMLGTEQEDWLKNRLSTAQADGVVWKVIVSPSSWNPLGKGYNNTPKGEDNWALFPIERTELINYINDPVNPIRNVFVVTGDMHTGGAYDDGTHGVIPELTVPHTNINQQNYCTGTNVKSIADCGLWTQILPGKNNAGFGWFDLTPTSANLKVIRADGFQQFSYTRTAQ
ncbi:hypothetical protein A2985_04815 [Candidatus Woesebacteria bacterium RIFCSPLOWO2_01_FULL_43_11]|uniref:Uncharacterized protein n=1 Tax=Candidatus Woesebacteria bacterium RBG_16_42_24 TaxID=1802485 RepID=A0A1F7XK53_9BACT|nr:MAG: hypothetical protein A2V97_02235 [Candidatus Woesebacteria bacterium RBG_16_42_24]OGM67801.1 MAG: hypothetical protein A2985_04815 [Candidatus Woesebacteria bacterium RIFCSPLOWO2_01_FULL_43_11]